MRINEDDNDKLIMTRVSDAGRAGRGLSTERNNRRNNDNNKSNLSRDKGEEFVNWRRGQKGRTKRGRARRSVHRGDKTQAGYRLGGGLRDRMRDHAAPWPRMLLPLLPLARRIKGE